MAKLSDSRTHIHTDVYTRIQGHTSANIPTHPPLPPSPQLLVRQHTHTRSWSESRAENVATKSGEEKEKAALRSGKETEKRTERMML